MLRTVTAPFLPLVGNLSRALFAKLCRARKPFRGINQEVLRINGLPEIGSCRAACLFCACTCFCRHSQNIRANLVPRHPEPVPGVWPALPVQRERFRHVRPDRKTRRRPPHGAEPFHPYRAPRRTGASRDREGTRGGRCEDGEVASPAIGQGSKRKSGSRTSCAGTRKIGSCRTEEAAQETDPRRMTSGFRPARAYVPAGCVGLY